MKSTAKTTSKNKKASVKKSTTTKAQAAKTVTVKRGFNTYISPTANDTKDAILVISLLINVFFLTAWITLAVSKDYALVIARSLAG